MIEKSVIYKFVSFFDGAESVALLCHVNPDSDTLGSALSLRLALKKLGKRCDVYCDDNPPERLMFLPSVKVVNECEGDKFKNTTLRCRRLQRSRPLQRRREIFQKRKKTLVIDHHKTNRNFADFTVCDANAGATAEIMTDVISCLSENAKRDLFDKEIATLLFSAIVGDTGAFSFDNTTKTRWKSRGNCLRTALTATL